MDNAKMEELKKLKSENALELEDLDAAAGGSCYEMADDSRFLNVLMRGLPNQPDRYGATRIWCMGGDIGNELRAAWKSLGIRFDFTAKTGKGNTYYLDLTGDEISREEAWDYVQARLGKHLKESDWNW